MAQNPSALKRQKERQRQEKQQEKAEKKKQRAAEKQARKDRGEPVDDIVQRESFFGPERGS